MVLTVGDIRKALEKYSDDTIIFDNFGEDERMTTEMPVDKNGFSVSKANVKKLKKQSRYWANCPDDVKSAICLNTWFDASYDYADLT